MPTIMGIDSTNMTWLCTNGMGPEFMARGRLLCLLADSEVCPSFEGNMMEVQQFAWPISIWLNWISIGFANCKQGQFTHIHTHLWSIRAMLLSLMLMLMLMMMCDDDDDGNPAPPYFRSAPKGILPPQKKTHQQSSERRPKPLSSPNLLVD